MQITETDIDFSRIDEHEFEELCFDLMAAQQFHQLKWRRGGSDKGRDIEGVFTVANPLIGPYDERWFAECKHHSAGISVSEISDKVEWARAEQTDHLLIFTTTYLTQHTHEWLTSMRTQCAFGIHVIEGKALKTTLVSQPIIAAKYFREDTASLVRDLLKQWTKHDVLPEAKAIYEIACKVNPAHLDAPSLLFLYAACNIHREAIASYCEEEGVEEWDFSFLLDYFPANTTHAYPVFTPEEMKTRRINFRNYSFRQAIITPGPTTNESPYRDVHAYINFQGHVLEIYLRAMDGQFDYRIGMGKDTAQLIELYKAVFNG